MWEWCLNEYDNPGRVETIGDARRVVRGGSWGDYVSYARADYRDDRRNRPNDRLNLYGFRVVGFVPVLK